MLRTLLKQKQLINPRNGRLFSSLTHKKLDRDQFHHTVHKLRRFFDRKGWKEVTYQHERSILAACEDPWTIASYTFEGEKWPLPQTSQMWLEYDLLKNPDVPGIYTISTSYRQEPNPIPDRHQTIFPMFEFEGRGDYIDLRRMEKQLLEHLGFGPRECFKEMNYSDACEVLDVESIEAEQEAELCETYGDIILLNRFPESTSPFWNMARERFSVPTKSPKTEWARKTDVLIHGQETIGSAERSTNSKMMRERFETISEGKYAAKIRELFGVDRVNKELENFLSLDLCVRYGGGVGINRLIRGMEMSNLFPKKGPLYPDFSPI